MRPWRFALLLLAAWLFQPAWAHDDFHGGCQFGPEQAARAEQRISANADDWMSHAQLICYHYVRGNLKEPGANPAAHLKHVLWTIAHHPDSPLLATGIASADPGYTAWVSPEAFRQARQLWLETVAKNPRNPRILANAALAVQFSDKELALNLLKRSVALASDNGEYAEALGHHLAMCVLGITGTLRDGGGFSTRDQPTEADLVLARQARTEFANSFNPVVLSHAAFTLSSYLARVQARPETLGQHRVLARKWIEKAKALDPDNPEWAPKRPKRDFRTTYADYQWRLRQAGPPDFRAYPVTAIYRGKPAAPKIELAPEENPKTLVDREDWSIFNRYRKGPDFAGHYTFALWSCGTECFCASLIDAMTGDIYPTPLCPFSWGFVHTVGINLRTFNPLRYHPDSRLLVATGCHNEENCGTYLYEWNGSQFVLVRKVLIDTPPVRR